MLTRNTLPLRNLRGNGGRTAALLAFAALMAAAVFGGALLIGGVRGGLDTVTARLGADILVTPDSAKNDFDAQTALLQAEPGYFYMDASVADQVAALDGVERVSPQLFLASTKSGCCSARLQMIGFDPASDFTIQPWIADTTVTGDMGLMDVVVGSNVDWSSVSQNGTLRFYDSECRVIGQFAPTGSTLDSAVYMNFDTCKALIAACREKGMFRYESLDADRAVSAVLVRLAPGADAAAVAARINETIPGVTAVASTRMVAGIADSLRTVSAAVTALIALVWGLGLGLTVLLFVLMMGERRREFAGLRAMGMSRRMVSALVAREALTVGALGGLAGIGLSGLVIFSFSRLIGQGLGVGFLIPGAGQTALLAAAGLASVLAASALAAGIAAGRLHRMDASLILKEGE